MRGSNSYSTVAEILANAHFSDDPKVMQLDQLAPEIRAHIVAAGLEGFRPISVRWPTGEFALMFCVLGTNMPSIQNVVAAYRERKQTNKSFPQGDVAWTA